MNQPKSTSVIRSLLLPVFLPSLLLSIGTGMITLVIPLLAVELTGSYGPASMIFAMLGAGTLASDIPSGLLVSRLGVKPAILVGLLLISLCSITAGLFSSVVVLGMASFFMGAGTGLVLLSQMTYIAEATTAKLGRAMATVGGTKRGGMLLGPILAGYAGKYLGFGTTLMIAGVIIGSASVFVVFLSSKIGKTVDLHKKSPLRTIGSIIKRYRSIFLTAGMALIGLQLLRTARVVIVPFWGDSIGLDSVDIGLITGVSAGLELTMFYPVGIIMDRFGRKWTAVPCIAILGLSFAILPLSVHFTSLLLVVLVSGIGNGLGSGIFLTLGADYSPPEERSNFLGVWRLGGDLGHTFGPFLVGILTGLFTLTVASLATAAIGLGSAAIMFFLVGDSRETRNSNDHN